MITISKSNKFIDISATAQTTCKFIFYCSDSQTAARGPKVARDVISFGPRQDLRTGHFCPLELRHWPATDMYYQSLSGLTGNAK